MLAMFMFIFVMVTFIFGFIALLQWAMRIFIEPAQASSPPMPVFRTESARAAKERDVLRQKIEALYFEKKISLSEMKQMLGEHPVEQPAEKLKREPEPEQPKPKPQPSISAVSQSSRVTPRVEETSGFFSSTSVKTLLFSGSALIIFSVYLFVRSYWDFVPNAAKFCGLLLSTLAFYMGGFSMVKSNKLPKTARTLLSLGLALIPFNVFAANILMLNRSMTTDQTWAVGSLVLFPAALLTGSVLPSLLPGLLAGVSFLGIFYWGGAALGLPAQYQCLGLSFATLLTGVFSMVGKGNDDVKKGILCVSNIGTAIVVAALSFNQFFVHETFLLPTVGTLLLMGVLYAVQSRLVDNYFAYFAGVMFMGATAVLLHHLQLRLYEYGYCFVPVGFAFLIRAWSFRKKKREPLAKPYFLFGQLCLMGSVLCVIGTFNTHSPSLFWPLMIILGGTSVCYAISGYLYRSSFYTYASALVVLFYMFSTTWHNDVEFAFAVLLFTVIAFLLLMVGNFSKSEELIGGPLSLIGLVTMSAALALLAGKWGNELFTKGVLMPVLPPDQIYAGLWTAGLSMAAYFFTAYFKKRAEFIYPALLSGTWLYICLLQQNSIPVNLLNASWIVLFSMTIYHAVNGLGWKKAGRCFALWAQMTALFIAIGTFYSNQNEALAVLLCTAAFIPGMIGGHQGLVFSFLSGLYLSHAHLFRLIHGVSLQVGMAEFALQLVAVNCGVVFIRTLVSRYKPEQPIQVYRFFALSFSMISLVMSIADLNIAWQVFLAYGILAVVVSHLHYQGRYLHVGTLLILVACELFLAAQDVTYREMYTLPVGVYLLWLGYLNRASSDVRDFLYGVAQIVIYLPSSIEAIRETWQWHGLFLGVSSLILMLIGIHQRSKVLMFPSLIVLIANGFIQSRQFFLTVPRWIYLGFGGLSLIGLGGLFEFKRESLIGMKKQLAETFEKWD